MSNTPFQIPSPSELQAAREMQKRLKANAHAQAVERALEEIVKSEMGGVPNTFWSRDQQLADDVVQRLDAAGWNVERCKLGVLRDRYGTWAEPGFGVRVK